MGSFREYFISLFTVCILCVLCDLLADFTSKGVSSALKLVCSIVLLLTVFSAILNGCNISSLKNSFSAIADTASYDVAVSSSDELFLEKTRHELEKNLSITLYEKFGIKPDYVSIEFNTEENAEETAVSVSMVETVLPGSTDDITVSAADIFIGSLFGTDAKITITRSN